MDLNFTRRKREQAIAKEIALSAFSATAGMIKDDNALINARMKLIEEINAASERHQLDEHAAKRVMFYLDKEIDRMNAEVASANAKVSKVNTALEAVIEAAT